MNTSIKSKVIQVVLFNVLDVFTSSIDSSDFIDKHIRPITPFSEEQTQKASSLLAEYSREWNNAPCDREGPTEEQEDQLDKISEECAHAIANLID